MRRRTRSGGTPRKKAKARPRSKSDRLGDRVRKKKSDRLGDRGQRGGWQRFLLRWGWILPAAALLVGASVLALTYAFASIPLPRDIEVASSAEVYDVKGRLIGTYTDEVRRFLIDTDELPDYVGQAVVAAEDRDFYSHRGISVRGIVRAAWANIAGGRITEGGSTITQQYVKNAVLEDPGRTVTRKAKEAVLAIKLERRYDKDEILGFYLNTIYLGRGAYGVEAAARTYFNKEATDLSLSEAAYLASIIPAPESYQIDDNPQGARTRRDRVLAQMEALGFITEGEFAEASGEELRLVRGGDRSGARRQRAAYFMEWLRKDYLYPEYGEDLYTLGLKIYTTLDLDMQRYAEEAIAATFTENTEPQAALVSMTRTGGVRAFVGGRQFTNVKQARGFNFAVDPPGRHAGSAFKPFTLLAAIEEGISPSSRFSGRSPMDIGECAGENGLPPWTVSNYGGSQFGTVDLVQATTSSINTVYAQLVQEVGAEDVAALLEEFDFDRNGRREVNHGCSLALGTLDVTPLEMARAYAAMAGRGSLPDVQPIRYITNRRGDCIKSYRPGQGEDCRENGDFTREQIVEENSVDVLNQTLTNVVSGGTATAARLPDGRQVAGKTGTSQKNINAWFGGHIPQLATMVWVGYPAEDHEGRRVVPEMRFCSDVVLCRPVQGREVTGGSFPAQIWGAYMARAVEGMEILAFPTPTALPSKVINSPAPEPTEPSPEDTPKDTPEPDPEPEPEPEPTEPSPEPPAPSPSPSPTSVPAGGDP